MKKTILIFIILLPTFVLAQDNDFQVWYSLSTNVKAGKKWTIGVSEEIRTSCNGGVFDKNLFDVGAEYEIRKNTDAGLFVRYSTNYPTLTDRTNKFSFYGMMQYSKKFDRLEAACRFRTGSDEDDNYLDGKEWEHRERIKLNYNLKGFPLNLEFSMEVFFPVEKNFLDLDKTRILAGFNWKPGKENDHAFALMYGWQHKYNTNNPKNDFLLCLEYKFTIKQHQKK